MKSTNIALRGLGFIAIALVIIFPFWVTSTANPESYLNVMITAGTSAVLTLSLNICMGYGGLLSLAHTGM